MQTTQTRPSALLSLCAVAAGNALYALTVKLFLLPSGLATGGTTGIALAANRLAGVPISAFVLGFNVLMLGVGWAVLGKTFALTTLASTFFYPLALEGFDRLLGDFVLTQDVLLCTLFSGLGIGAALGVVIRAGASTGGMDIPPLVLQKLCRVPVSASMYGFDVCILLLQAFFTPADRVLYGVVLVMVYTIVLDKMLLWGATRTEVKVVSQRSAEIRAAILTELDRGVTLLHGQGGYLGQPADVLLSVVSHRELPRLEKLIHTIDPESFVIVSQVSEVSGRGFSMKKRYR